MSFIINKNSSKTWYPTLKEKSLLALPKYLWVFTNSTNIPIYCLTLTDLSSQLNRYNEFTITEMGTAVANPLLGQVNFTPGDYDYIVYEQTSSTNLDPTGLNEVERGIITCFDTASNTSKILTGVDNTVKILN